MKHLNEEQIILHYYGDAENDHAFLRACGAAAAVANALPAVKDEADLRLRGARGAGVVELIEMIVNDEERIIHRQRDRSETELESAQLGASEAGGEH